MKTCIVLSLSTVFPTLVGKWKFDFWATMAQLNVQISTDLAFFHELAWLLISFLTWILELTSPNVSVISLPSLSGSPSMTSVEYDSQSRTLTCTSTGGPATTVTWRRDGAMITYQQTKRVVNTTTGTYQTVLIIDPSVSQSGIVGTYNCTVENVRGNSSKLYPIAGSGELMIPYKYYLLRLSVHIVIVILNLTYTFSL